MSRVVPLRTDGDAAQAAARLWNQRQHEMRSAAHPLCNCHQLPCECWPEAESLTDLLIRKGSMEPPKRITKTSRLRLVARRIYRWLAEPAN